MPETPTLEQPAVEEERMPSMSFLEHLEELRTRIFHAVVAIACGMVLCWFIRERLVTFM